MTCRSIVFFLLFLPTVCPSLCLASNGSDVIVDIVKKRSDAVVLIAVESPDGDRLGSGFAISRDGKIVTNYHVLKGASKVLVKLKNGRAYSPRRIINIDPAKDIAVIQIDKGTPVYFPMGDSNKVIAGERVLTIGNPQGLESTVADGLISSIRLNDSGMKIFQISVPLSNGSSGGPLIDLNGQVIGITTAAMNDGQNLNFAVPINYVRILLRKPFRPERGEPMVWQSAPVRVDPVFTADPGSDKSVYIVRKGDSLYGIAKRFKTSVEELKRINLLKDAKILAGQRLKLP
jgi:S1-C subfamily serine protease